MAYKLRTLEDGSGVCVGTVIRFETVTILLDPAWSNSKVPYDKSVSFWASIIPDVDIILISQSTVDCLGAYPLLYYNFLSHFISRIHVYTTLPITNLGRVATIDLYVSGGVAGPYASNEMDIDDIESAFDFIEALKFSQDVDLRSRYDGLSMTAYSSGYSPGSSIWCITNYSEKLLYAKNWNHSKSTILNAAALLDSSGKSLSALSRPSSVITSLTQFGSSRPLKRRVNMFNETLRKSLMDGGSVIIPCEIGGNFLDLLAMTHNFLYERSNNGKQSKVPILLVSYAKGRTVTYAQSMMEWLSSTIIKKWENRNGRSPFDVNNILKPVTPKEILKQKGPSICFVSEVDSCISETMKNLSEISNVTVLLTSNRENNQPILDKMKVEWLEHANGKVQEGANISYSTTAEFEIANLKPLKDESLIEFNEKIDRRRKQRKEDEIVLRKESKLSGSFAHSFGDGTIVSPDGTNRVIGDVNGEDDDDDDEDDDDLIDILKGKGKNNKEHEIPMDTIILPNSSIKNKMFQFKPVKHKIDEYGSFVNIDQLIPKESKEQEEDKISSQKRNVRDNEDEKENNSEATNRSKKQKKDRQTEKENAERKKKEKMKFDNLEYLDAKNHPCLRIFQKETATISCQLSFINLDNVVDQRSASVIWPTLKPRKIILLGSKEIQDENVVSILLKRKIERPI